ncbi:hypothetical protein E5D57_004165 [Metarhizium anisopliae]|nr:hypothetical protein E5D57_004165 [Metarhizium anisopliae]
MTAANIEASDTTAPSPYDTLNSIFSSTLHVNLSKMFGSQFPDSIEVSSSSGSSSALSHDTFFSMLDASEHENTPQALINVINGILGPIQESQSTMSDESWTSGADDNDPEPSPPPSPPKTPPPFWPRPRPRNRAEQDGMDVWDMISDEEEAREAEWETL